VAQLDVIPYVQPDFTWLMVVKMIGYFLSFILLAVFSTTVCMSK
jgi:hypothetical protein